MNFYPFHIGDFRSGTVNMSRLSRWIYRDMIDVYYDKEGPLTKDFDLLCEDLGVDSDEERGIVKRLLRFKFIEADDGYHHEACDRVIAEYRSKAEIAKQNGKKSTATRYQNGEYMPTAGKLYAVRVDADRVKVGVSSNLKSRIHQLRSKYGKQIVLIYSVDVAHMGNAEDDLLVAYESSRFGEVLPVKVAGESHLRSMMDRIAVAYPVASYVASWSPSGSHTNQEPITNNQSSSLRSEDTNARGADDEPEPFDVFWTEYPKKVGKGAAQRAWAKIKRPKETLEAMLLALAWQKKSEQWTRDGGQYIPNPATYLNQQRWMDEPPTGRMQRQQRVHHDISAMDYTRGVDNEGRF